MDVLASNRTRLTCGDVVHRGDVVLIKDGPNFIAGQIWYNAGVDEVLFSVVECWTLVQMLPDRNAAEWLKNEDDVQLIAIEDIMVGVIWMQIGNVVRTLLPYSVR